VLDLSQNQLTGSLGPGLASLGGSLRELRLASNRITSLEHLENLSALVVLDFSFNEVKELREIVRL
jgi:Leucine-rich repeat (LRR) protein